jgi:hypothetical protein
MDTDIRRTTMQERPLDQAPAADPALDALDRLVADAEAYRPADVATIRATLADRITPEMARLALVLLGEPSLGSSWEKKALIARLGKITEQGDAHR